MTPTDEAVGILRGLSGQVKDVEPHCIEIRSDPEEGTFLSLEYLCGDLVLWVQLRVESADQVDETDRAWVTAQLEPIALPQPLGVSRLLRLIQHLQGIWPALHGDVSVRNRGSEECIVEGEWYGDVAPSGNEGSLFPAIASLLHGMQEAAIALEEALQEAEHMQEVEERVAGVLLGSDHHSGPRKRPGGPGRRRPGSQRR